MNSTITRSKNYIKNKLNKFKFKKLKQIKNFKKNLKYYNFRIIILYLKNKKIYIH